MPAILRFLSFTVVLLAALVMLQACDSAGSEADDAAPSVEEPRQDDPAARKARWIRQQTPVSERIGDISFFDENVGYAVARGQAATVLATTDGGATWETTATYDLQRDTGTFLGFANDSSGIIGAEAGHILRTIDGGATWESMKIYNTWRWLLSIGFVDQSTAFIGGGGGILLKSTDGGQTWVRPLEFHFDLPIYGIEFADPELGVLVGDQGAIFRTTDGGAAWTRLESPTSQILNGFTFVDASVGIAVGDKGTVVRTTDAGATWHKVSSGTSATLWNVDAGEDGFVVAAGGSVIIVSTDAGATWHREDSGTATGLNRPHVLSADAAWIGGSGGTILRRTISD